MTGQERPYFLPVSEEVGPSPLETDRESGEKVEREKEEGGREKEKRVQGRAVPESGCLLVGPGACVSRTASLRLTDGTDSEGRKQTGRRVVDTLTKGPPPYPPVERHTGSQVGWNETRRSRVDPGGSGEGSDRHRRDTLEDLENKTFLFRSSAGNKL